LKKTRRVSAPTVRLKLSRTSPDCLSVPMTPTYEPGHSDSFNRTIAKLACGFGPLERVSTSMTPSSKRPTVPVSSAPPLTGTVGRLELGVMDVDTRSSGPNRSEEHTSNSSHT